MSDSSLLKTFSSRPSSQDTLRRTLEILLQPSSLAILASLSIHGLLWATLPMLNLDKPEQTNQQRTVKVVQLSPAERQQLPNLAPPQATTASPPLTFPSFPSLTQPSLSLRPKSTQVIPRRLTLPTPIDDSEIYRFPIIPPPPVTILPPLFNPLPQLNKPISQLNKPPVQPSPSPSPTPSASPESTARTEPGLTGPTRDQTVTPAPPTVSANVTRPEKIPQAAIDRLRDLQARGVDVYDAAGTSNEQATAQLGSWFDKVKSTNEVSEKVLEAYKVVAVTPKYPAEACPGKLKGDAAVGLLIDPDGKIVDQPELLKSTGYKRLNKAALDAAKAYESEVKATGDYQLYLLRLPFEYQEANCPATPQSAPSPEPSPAS